jgi:outer membrane protein assembly factor BamB
MDTHNRDFSDVHKSLSLVCGVVVFLAISCLSQTVSTSPKTGPPTLTVLVSGSGFGASAAIDIYFDTTDEALAIANGSGAFSKIPITVPASATPGTHFVSAVQRSNDTGAQAKFNVDTDWNQFHFTPNHKGLNPYENVLNSSNVSGLDVRWSFPLGSSQSSPAVVNNVAYIGNSNGIVYAVNESTGAPLWQYATLASVASSPAVVNGIVYVGSNDTNVYALKASTGALLWQYTTEGAVTSSPAVVNGVVYVTSNNSAYALTASTGALVWQYTTTGDILQLSPAVANGVVYAGSADNVYALNASTGALLYHYATGLEVTAPLTVVTGVDYVPCSDEGLGIVGGICEINASTSSSGWTFVTGGPVESSPAVVDGVVYFGADDNNFYAVKATSGKLLWQYTTGGGVSSSPAVANGVVYVGSEDGNLYAFDDNGDVLWQYATGGAVSSPAVSNGEVYVVSQDGNLYSFGLTNPSRQAVQRPNLKQLQPNLNLAVSNQRPTN